MYSGSSTAVCFHAHERICRGKYEGAVHAKMDSRVFPNRCSILIIPKTSYEAHAG